MSTLARTEAFCESTCGLVNMRLVCKVVDSRKHPVPKDAGYFPVSAVFNVSWSPLSMQVDVMGTKVVSDSVQVFFRHGQASCAPRSCARSAMLNKFSI